VKWEGKEMKNGGGVNLECTGRLKKVCEIDNGYNGELNPALE